MAKFPDKVSYNYVAPRLGLGYFSAKDKISQLSCLSTLVCSAIVGGKATSKKYKNGKTMNYAFNVPFVGGSVGDGRLIDGAQPRWNIWSNNSPGEWILPIAEPGDPAIQECQFRLKHDSSNEVRYDLADFAGYDPDAIAPSLPKVVISGFNGDPFNTMITDVELGSYDWSKINPTLQYVRLVSVNSNDTINYLSDPVSLSSAELSILIKGSIPSAETSKDMYLALCNSYGDEQAFIPNPGSITLVPATYTLVVFNIVISVDDYFARVRSESAQILSGQSAWSSTITTNQLLNQAKFGNLVKVEYVATNAAGEKFTKIRTSIDQLSDSPLTTTDFKEFPAGSTMPVKVKADSEVYSHAGVTGGNIVITMTYN